MYTCISGCRILYLPQLFAVTRIPFRICPNYLEKHTVRTLSLNRGNSAAGQIRQSAGSVGRQTALADRPTGSNWPTCSSPRHAPLSQMNPIHIIIPVHCFFKVHFNTVLSAIHSGFLSSFSSQVSHNKMYAFLTASIRATCPAAILISGEMFKLRSASAGCKRASPYVQISTNSARPDSHTHKTGDTHHPGDGGSKHISNVPELLSDYMVQQPRRQPSFILGAVRTCNILMVREESWFIHSFVYAQA
jgi:hypothetical protein